MKGGSRIVEKLTEDSSPQISASEVTYNADSGTALIKFETVSGESKMTNLEILGWVIFSVCMVILAIPAYKAIKKILNICGNCTDTYTVELKTSNKDLDFEEKYQAKTSATPVITEDKGDFDSGNIISIARNQDKINKEIRFLELEKDMKA